MACGDDDGSSQSNNAVNNANAQNNTQNNAQNNADQDGANNDDAAAQELGGNVFGAFSTMVMTNVLAKAQQFESDGTEGELPCIGLAGGADGYGTITVEFTDTSTAGSFDVTGSLNGCLAMESGSNAPLEISGEDPSGDGVVDIYRIDGTLAAMTFDEDGSAPVDDSGFPPTPDYDPEAEPTCADIVFDGVVLEIPGASPDGMSLTNVEEPHNPGGYTEGFFTAECNGRAIRCEIGGATTALATLSLDTIAAAKGEESICVFED